MHTKKILSKNKNLPFGPFILGLAALLAIVAGTVYFSQGTFLKGQFFDFSSIGKSAEVIKRAEKAWAEQEYKLAAENAKINALNTFFKLTGKWTWRDRKEINDWTSKEAKGAAEKGNTAWDLAEAALRQSPPDYQKAKTQFDAAQSEYQKVVYWQDWFNKHPETTVTPIAPKIPAIPPDLMQITPLVPDSFTVTPATIYPKNYNTQSFFTRINFKLYANSMGSLKVFRGNTLVKTIEKDYTSFLKQKTPFEYLWNGEDDAGATVQAGVYTVRLDLFSNSGNDTAKANVTVIVPDPTPPTVPIVPPKPPVPPTPVVKETIIREREAENTCAGFKDVLFTSPLCSAIQYAKEQGIFSGYPDGTFRPYDVINRAEAVKVILNAFRKTILVDNGSRMYFDTEAGASYSPYLRTGQIFGIGGYADGTFRPAQQVNKVEFLKMFFNISGRDLSGLIINEKPYADTPIDKSTSWYLKYVQFAKNYALIAASKEGLFYPAAGMLRGDVAELFYRYHLAALNKP